MKRTGRWLRRLAFALPLLAVACASTADSGSGGGPSSERQMDLLGLVAGTAILITLGTLMYIDNQD